MSKLLKSIMREEVRTQLEGVDGGVIVSAQGLDSEKTYSFRSAMHGQGIKYTIIRNAFARDAFISFGYDAKETAALLKGPLAVVYTDEENSAPTSAKALSEWKKANKDKIILIKGGFMDGEIFGAKRAAGLKDLPTKDGARAMLLGIIQAPVTQLLATIREPHARVVYLLNSWKDKREEAGEK